MCGARYLVHNGSWPVPTPAPSRATQCTNRIVARFEPLRKVILSAPRADTSFPRFLAQRAPPHGRNTFQRATLRACEYCRARGKLGYLTLLKPPNASGYCHYPDLSVPLQALKRTKESQEKSLQENVSLLQSDNAFLADKKAQLETILWQLCRQVKGVSQVLAQQGRT